MSKKLLIVLAVFLLAVFLVGCTPAEEGNGAEEPGGEGTLDALTVEEGKFTVGFDQDFPPMGFVGDDGQYTGFDLDLAAEVAERNGWEFVPQPIAWDSKDSELKVKNIDCIWNGFTMQEREDKYTWTTPYMSNEQLFVVMASSGIKTLADLAGKVVSVQTESSAEKALAGRADLTETFEDLVSAPDYNTCLMDLESGAVDCVAMDETFARFQIEKRGAENYFVLDETLAEEDYGVGFLLGNTALRDKVQETLEEMAADGTLAEISIKWFGKDITVIGK